MFRHAALVAFAVLASACSTQPDRPPTASLADFTPALGGGWTGTLTYRDYSPPHGDVTLTVELTVTASADGVDLAFAYPKEPNANATDHVVLSADGRTLDGEAVVARTARDGAIELTTRAAGEDDNRPATIEHTYTIGAHRLVIRKTVQFGDAAPLRRNEFVFGR